jgi:large subunit ribosomal protein L23
MALFGKNKTSKKTDVLKSKSPKKVSNVILSLIKEPRITEKGAILAMHRAYAFNIRQEATKADVKTAISKIYNVSPVKVNIVRNKGKKVFSRGKRGTTPGLKKAYVFLKKGDKIEFV